MVEDFVDSIVESIYETIADLLSSAIIAVLDQVISLLSNSVTGTGTLGKVVQGYIDTAPQVKQSTLWDNIQVLSEDVIVPFAVMIVGVLSVYDLCLLIIENNNFNNLDVTDVMFKWGIKTWIALYILSNTYSIVEWVFSQTTIIAQDALDYVGDFVNDDQEVLSTLQEKLATNYEIGELLIILLLAIVMLISVFALLVVIIVVLCSRMIEAVMYMSIAPIPMATYINNEWRQVGNGWVRGLLALGFQTFFIVVALAFFAGLFNTTITNLAKGTNMILNMVITCGYSLALIFTVLRSSQISKSIFGAH